MMLLNQRDQLLHREVDCCGKVLEGNVLYMRGNEEKRDAEQ